MRSWKAHMCTDLLTAVELLVEGPGEATSLQSHTVAIGQGAVQLMPAHSESRLPNGCTCPLGSQMSRAANCSNCRSPCMATHPCVARCMQPQHQTVLTNSLRHQNPVLGGPRHCSEDALHCCRCTCHLVLSGLLDQLQQQHRELVGRSYAMC